LSGTSDLTLPVDHHFRRFRELGYRIDEAMAAPCMFGAAGSAYLKRYDAKPEIFAAVSVKTRRHAEANPYALFTKPLTVEEVLAAQVIYEPYLTKLMACPPTCGAAAAIVVSESFARRKGIAAPVVLAGQAMTTDTNQMYVNAMDLVGRDMTKRAADQAYAEAGIGPEEADVVELHDCFTPNEVITYEALGLCAEGGAARFIHDGQNTYGGRVVVNPSGGLMSKGHPLGATGLAQCAELVWQLRGQAGRRQVPDARIAVQHNIGLGGAAVVTVYGRAA
jgi:acetyl-CoA acetyltransferase